MSKTLLTQLKDNKGTLSSALGKSLAERVLKGDKSILKEASELIEFDNKNVRAGAAKIFEMVAEKKPEVVKEYLKDLLPGLDVAEPQTRWMIMRTIGLCSILNPQIASQVLGKAKQYLEDTKAGACLWNRTIFYLGCIGVLSIENAKQAYTLLNKALKEIPNQENTILDAFMEIAQAADNKVKTEIINWAKKYAGSPIAGIKARANKILKKYV